jgi:FkbM family methyltransferase
MKRFAQRAARSTGVIVAMTDQVHMSLEALHLARFIEHFGVDLVIDIGAHTGEYRSMLRDRVGYRGRILSCEPNPELAAGLLAATAHDETWTIAPVAVGETAGTATLHVMADDRFSSMSAPTLTEKTGRYERELQTTREVEVEMTTVDALIRRYAKASDKGAILVKVDTQGLEKPIVLGARHAYPDIAGFQLELSFKRLYETSWLFSDAVPELSALGFELTAMFPNVPPPFPELIEMDAIFRNAALGVEPRCSNR